jgi:hypothetical protein
MFGMFGKPNGPLWGITAGGGAVYSTDTFKCTACAEPSTSAPPQAQDAKQMPVNITEENVMFIF